MTRETGREHEQDQHGLVAAYTYAATAHDQAAQMHEKVAEHYDKRGKAARAMHERRMAAQERRSAVADRKWVANLTADTGSEIGGSSDESDRPGPHGADLAALIGATIAVLFTITNTPGAWGYLSTLIGLLLLIILLTFFWRRRPPVKGTSSAEQRNIWKSFFVGKNRELVFIGVALSLVMGYVVAIATAWAVQSLGFSDDSKSPECRSVAVGQATTAVRDLSDIYNNTSALQQLVHDALQNGAPSAVATPTDANTALRYNFYNEYGGAIGDCLAGETFGWSLWWIGIPSFLLTLAWWNWKYIRSLTATALKELGDMYHQIVRRLRGGLS